MESLEKVVDRLRDVAGRYEERTRLADDIARRLAQPLDGAVILGRVSVLEQVRPDRIPVDVPPQVWVQVSSRWPELLSAGYYLAIVDPKTLSLVLASVEETVTATALASLHSGPPPSHIGLEGRETPLQSTAYRMIALRVWLRPLILVHLGEDCAEKIRETGSAEEAASLVASRPATAPSIPPDPDSPVIAPHPSILQALLATEQGSGVTIGALGVMDTTYTVGSRVVPVELSWRTLVKHMLVTGTTGSGKTSFVKNLLYNALRARKARALVLDANGDYVASLLPGYIPGILIDHRRALILQQVYGVAATPGRPVAGQRLEGLIVAPFYRGDNRVEACARYRGRLEALAKAMYEKLGCRVRVVHTNPMEDLLCEYTIEIAGCSEAGLPERIRHKLHVALRSINVGGDARRVASIDPMLTERAREELRRIQSIIEREAGEGRGSKPQTVYELREWVEANRSKLVETYRVHRETLNHILRRLEALASMGVIDTGAPELDYANIADTARQLGKNMVVLDLDYASINAPREADPRGVKVLLGARMLQTLLGHVEREASAEYTLLVVDEAHLFFPSRRGEDYSELLASWLERLARLGRARGIAIVFSTHREDDVSPLVTTLANTRVYFRTDERTAERLALPAQYRRQLPYFADHAAVLSSYAVRGGYITITTAPAIPGHRTA